MIKVAYIVPLLAPYADIRYQMLGKLNEIEVHVIAERSTSNERTGWKYHDIPGVYTHLLSNTVGKKFSISNDRDGYSVQKEHVYPMGLKKVLIGDLINSFLANLIVFLFDGDFALRKSIYKLF